jgi:hypothetical protein
MVGLLTCSMQQVHRASGNSQLTGEGVSPSAAGECCRARDHL